DTDIGKNKRQDLRRRLGGRDQVIGRCRGVRGCGNAETPVPESRSQNADGRTDLRVALVVDGERQIVHRCGPRSNVGATEIDVYGSAIARWNSQALYIIDTLQVLEKKDEWASGLLQVEDDSAHILQL